jgi:hypothetical protein
MLCEAPVDIVGYTNIKRAVKATQHVNVVAVHPTSSACRGSKGKIRARPSTARPTACARDDTGGRRSLWLESGPEERCSVGSARSSLSPSRALLRRERAFFPFPSRALLRREHAFFYFCNAQLQIISEAGNDLGITLYFAAASITGCRSAAVIVTWRPSWRVFTIVAGSRPANWASIGAS